MLLGSKHLNAILAHLPSPSTVLIKMGKASSSHAVHHRSHFLRVAAISGLIGMTVISCAKSTTSSDSQTTSSPSGEAASLAQRYWNNELTKCDEMYYGRDTQGSIAQLRGCTFAGVHEEPLGDTDRANGYEWRGQTTVTCQMIRECEDMGNGCTEWKDWGSANSVFGFTRFGRAVELSKQKGKWFIDLSPAESSMADKIGCEEARREVANRGGH